MKHLFIVNPVAGGKDRREYVAEQARRALEGSEDAYEVYVTTAPMDACAKIAAEAASGEELRVYACGGDGTLNECVNGAVGHSNVAVTHFPCGTGNDFIKMFGEEKERFFDLADLVRGEVRSYRQLPVRLYQVQTKFRDEIRPRFGLMRGREFMMKDGYSFDATAEGAEESYKIMYDAYTVSYTHLTLPTILRV